MPHTSTRPKHHVNFSTPLMVNVRGVHGHEAYCSCGWVGMTWKHPSNAQGEAKWHFYHVHGDPSATGSAEASDVA